KTDANLFPARPAASARTRHRQLFLIFLSLSSSFGKRGFLSLSSSFGKRGQGSCRDGCRIGGGLSGSLFCQALLTARTDDLGDRQLSVNVHRVFPPIPEHLRRSEERRV